MAKIGAPIGNRNASGKGGSKKQSRVGGSFSTKSFLGITSYNLKDKNQKSEFQAKFPNATDAFLKKYDRTGAFGKNSKRS